MVKTLLLTGSTKKVSGDFITGREHTHKKGMNVGGRGG